VFSIDIDTFISFFELCRGLDIWIFYAYDSSRHIMLNLNKLQGKEISDDRIFIDRIFIDAGNCQESLRRQQQGRTNSLFNNIKVLKEIVLLLLLLILHRSNLGLCGSLTRSLKTRANLTICIAIFFISNLCQGCASSTIREALLRSSFSRSQVIGEVRTAPLK
jgi:hypothetical protein